MQATKAVDGGFKIKCLTNFRTNQLNHYRQVPDARNNIKFQFDRK